MNIAIVKEDNPEEKRVPLLPSTVSLLAKLGATVVVEKGLAESLDIRDESYQTAGGLLGDNREEILSGADLVIKIKKPKKEDVRFFKKGALLICFLDPFYSRDLIKDLAESGVDALALELIPRSTRAQKMDALSSQASLAGYASVIMAASYLPKIFPMMTTPSGTLSPARVFVIGAGVAGLQAIATAKRLGARVEAFDTREVVCEQVQSLGARFLKIDLQDNSSDAKLSSTAGQTKEGYAQALTDQQLRKQREGIKKACQTADVVITTAQTFGRSAPLIITRDILLGMKPGSLVFDLAVESGGNVEGVEVGLEVKIGPARLFGFTNITSRVALDASQMFSNNVGSFVSEFWDSEKKSFSLRQDDEIIKSCLVTHQGQIVHEKFK